MPPTLTYHRLARSPVLLLLLGGAALALSCSFPASALAGTSFFARMDYAPNGVLSAFKSASIQIKTTKRMGANGILLSAKVVGARDMAGLPANVTIQAQTAWGSPGGCSAQTFAVPIVNGSANIKATGTDVGLSEDNANPGRILDLACFHPTLYSNTFAAIATFHLFSQSPGTILQAPFALSTNASNPITRWSSAKIRVRNVAGDIVATTTIGGAREGSVPSSRAIVVFLPEISVGLSCTQRFFIDQTVVLENGRGRSIRPNFDNDDADDPGNCLREFALKDSSGDVVSDGFGVVQGIDAD